MPGVLVNSRHVAFSTVLMAAGYASKSLLRSIERLDKTYDVPLTSNRLVEASNRSPPYQGIDTLQWTDVEQVSGKRIKLHKFPTAHKAKVFRGASAQRTDSLATNALSPSDGALGRQVCDGCWKLERFHREAKQLTGLESGQGRLPRIVRNHIADAFLVWGHLMHKAYETPKTLYQVKHG